MSVLFVAGPSCFDAFRKVVGRFRGLRSHPEDPGSPEIMWTLYLRSGAGNRRCCGDRNNPVNPESQRETVGGEAPHLFPWVFVSSLLLALRVSMVFVSFSTESGGLEGLRLVIYLVIFLRLAPKSQSTHELALELVSGPDC